MEFDYIVIGAGSSGLAFSALMEKQGFKVALLEAHSLPGGCSSYFERDGFCFDVGATTLSGLSPGRPLDRLMRELNLELDILPIDPGIVSVVGGKKIRHYKNLNSLIKELNHHFPEVDNEALWKRLSKLDSDMWDVTGTFKRIPLRSLSDLATFISPKLYKALTSAPKLFTSVKSAIEKYNIQDDDYISVLNELLFVSAQNNYEDTPFLIGAMSLCYTNDTGYAIGGMKAFSHALAAKCSHLFYRHKALEIKVLKEGFEVKTVQRHFTGKKLVSTLPFWNHRELFSDQKALAFFSSKNIPDPKECWSAFMVYLTVPTLKELESLYYQVHCKDLPGSPCSSFFASFSHPQDHLRTLGGRQVVSLATHTRSHEWLDLNKEDYETKKASVSRFLLDVFKERFELQESDIQNVITATPKTFIKYTKRYQGLVGGIPHSIRRSPFEYMRAKSPYENFYMLGDTQFPGQGIVAVTMGALNLKDYLIS